MDRKWLGSSVLLFVVILGCNESVRLPTAPPPPPPTVAQPPSEVWLRGSVYDTESRCLEQAAVVIMAGRNTGATHRIGCSYLFKDLLENDVIILRATAPGYVAKEVQITLVPDLDGWVDYDFRLAKE